MNEPRSIANVLLAVSCSLNVGFAFAQSSDLEDAFFQLLDRCDSPILAERDAAEDELTRRLMDFESIWQDRRFLSDGEASAESALRFELAEARRLNESIEQTRKSFVAKWIVDEPIENPQVSRATRRCVVRFVAPKDARIVYFTPIFDTFSYYDENDRTWRPASLFSSPELTPEFGAVSFEIETALVCDDKNAGETIEKTPSFEGTLDALVGVDTRGLTLDVARDSERVQTARSGEVVVVGALATSRQSGCWTIEIKIEYDEAYDAFDSHRVWLALDDFVLIDEIDDKRFKPRRLRQRSRTARSVVLELDFVDDPALNETIESGRACFSCRIPRCFALLRIDF